ncbi:peptide ABC transporter permease [Caballeronia mineralivorans PML1(12)]|uniref:Peptide ABC transporter permease n=1 Tax=Caballeronia mineralivorans PML1(12) TaxID=908627 RepID=A0A0J1D090_9BURK|nr:ABC transporter permease [Caballeronia mineralivorans]KLU26177.1 peptide ABC transporter permease [Caballeronia mineralivorans PML1(12)]
MQRLLGALASSYLGLVLVFLYLPIVIMMAMAFNRSELYQLPFQFDLVWFKTLAQDNELLQAGLNSVLIAMTNTLIATLLGTLTALAFARYSFAGKPLLHLLLMPSLIFPWLITGTAMMIFFYWVGINRSLHAILLGHVALSLPYVVLIVGSRLKSVNLSLEEAATILGASAWQTFWRITVPLLAPGIVAAALFAFAVSFDQFVISYFLAPIGVSTLPVEIYSAIRKGYTPEINAISTLIILFSMGLMGVFARFSKFGGER